MDEKDIIFVPWKPPAKCPKFPISAKKNILKMQTRISLVRVFVDLWFGYLRNNIFIMSHHV